jgi:endonuclease/exonuclease/phosphatase family metal-dependent hydrolase
MFEHVKSFHQILNDETKRPSNATVLVCQLEHRGAGKPVTVMATHLKAKQGFEKTRAAQATHLLEILKAQRAECVILAGDFNAGLEERVYPLVLAEGLASAYAAVQGREPPYTTWKVGSAYTEYKVMS